MNSCSIKFSADGAVSPCTVAVAGNIIHIYPDAPGAELLAWNAASLSACTYSGGRVTARYRDAELSCYGEVAAQVYNAWAEKDKVFPKDNSGRTFRNVVIFITLGFIALIAAVYFFILPWVAGKAVHLIPKDMEIQLGEQMSESFRQGQPPSRADSVLNAFAASIDFDSDYELKLHVLDAPEINAFALPGGHIFVYTGILEKMDSYEQLAALLAHEVMHVQKRHSLRSVSRALASGLFISAVFGDAGGISGALLSQADEFRNLSYSRDLETEADLFGLQVLHTNGISQKGMLDLLRLLDREGAKTPGLMKYLSTHPETEERIQKVRAHMSADDGGNNLPGILPALFDQLRKTIR